MNRSTKHEINGKLQLIMNYASKLEAGQRHAVEAAVWDIKGLVNERIDEKFLREFDELLEARGDL